MSERFWDGRPVLVTGASGLLGSWLVAALHERGARVVTLVRDLVPDALFHTGGAAARSTIVLGDICDGALVERVLAEYEIDAVFHLAAQTIVEHAQRNPVGTLRANVEGTWEVLDACRRSGRPTRIVVASSDKAYGDQPVLPYTEDQPLEGRHPYDVSKSCCDLIAQAYANSYDLPVAITRCGNLYGGGDLNFNRLVPGTIRSLLAGERPVLRSDGSPQRDYIYVEDAAAAYLQLAERTHEDGVAGEAWNFSTESPLTALSMTEAITAAVGRPDLEPLVEATAHHEIQDQFLSAAKARSVLGWEPLHGLEEGLRRTVEWYRDYLARA
ncbi:MAG TPA: NAD-dependent epimerase/dehydratase family protein [Gaiellaceae bacterium]|jgi:CDP-glucose 4,6-dehydratase|nr:NAD-dependent epimerase/dehydratase family protein [Gaiellaceae bacterium]